MGIVLFLTTCCYVTISSLDHANRGDFKSALHNLISQIITHFEINPGVKSNRFCSCGKPYIYRYCRHLAKKLFVLRNLYYLHFSKHKYIFRIFWKVKREVPNQLMFLPSKFKGHSEFYKVGPLSMGKNSNQIKKANFMEME